MGGWGPEIPFLERIEKPVRKNGPPLIQADPFSNFTAKFQPFSIFHLKKALFRFEFYILMPPSIYNQLVKLLVSLRHETILPTRPKQILSALWNQNLLKDLRQVIIIIIIIVMTHKVHRSCIKVHDPRGQMLIEMPNILIRYSHGCHIKIKWVSFFRAWDLTCQVCNNKTVGIQGYNSCNPPWRLTDYKKMIRRTKIMIFFCWNV